MQSQGEQEGGPSEVQIGGNRMDDERVVEIAQAEKSHKKILVCGPQTLPERK